MLSVFSNAMTRQSLTTDLMGRSANVFWEDVNGPLHWQVSLMLGALMVQSGLLSPSLREPTHRGSERPAGTRHSMESLWLAMDAQVTQPFPSSVSFR